MEFSFCNSAALDDTSHGTQRQHFRFVIRDDNLLTGVSITPFLVTSPLRDKFKSMSIKNTKDFFRLHSGKFPRH